jgi:hypothetical protein
MTPSSHIRRIALIAVIGCAILAGWTSAAAARPIDDPALQNARTAEPRASSSGQGSDRTLPIVFAVAVVLVAVGTGGYAYRARTSRRAIA